MATPPLESPPTPLPTPDTKLERDKADPSPVSVLQPVTPAKGTRGYYFTPLAVFPEREEVHALALAFLSSHGDEAVETCIFNRTGVALLTKHKETKRVALWFRKPTAKDHFERVKCRLPVKAEMIFFKCFPGWHRALPVSGLSNGHPMSCAKIVSGLHSNRYVLNDALAEELGGRF